MSNDNEKPAPQIDELRVSCVARRDPVVDERYEVTVQISGVPAYALQAIIDALHTPVRDAIHSAVHAAGGKSMVSESVRISMPIGKQ